uniref:BACK domain-containing protein n=1 Tax=Panagrellus redivivus TaxID=6233 RepID=A0A7E4USW1_PANRE
MERLQDADISSLELIRNDNKLCEVLNAAVECSQDDLIAHCLEQVKTSNFSIITSENFKTLHVKAVSYLLPFLASKVPDFEIFNAFVAWMNANPSESTHFTELLKHIYLKNITLHTLAQAIQQCENIDVIAVLNIVNQQEEKLTYPFGNVITPASGVRVVTGGPSTFFDIPAIGSNLKHKIGDDNEDIIVDLGGLFKLNHLVIELANGNWSYWIEVFEDMVNWNRVVDYSKYICRSVQRLYFKESAVRYIRICGTAPVKGIFEISRLEAYYTENPLDFDPETGIVIPSDNVALQSKNVQWCVK